MHAETSIATTDSVQDCYYKEVCLDFQPVEATPVAHMLPLLEGPSAGGKDTLNTIMQHIVKETRRHGAEVCTFPVQWRCQTGEEIQRQLIPMVSHYRIQGLLVQERTRRLSIEVTQLAWRHNLMSAFNYTASLSQRLSMYWTQLRRQVETRPFNSDNFNKFSLSLPNTSRWSEASNVVDAQEHYATFSMHSTIRSDSKGCSGSTSFPSHSSFFSPSLQTPVRYDATLTREYEN
ncbi:unnamed protein product [Phytomonas sp. EM1]|nr:unnamed protein product [Phytomonas sp. EM1]|eukprot:CCW62801.1 unnamed protein product [Phytomonas sp. isolate EM1]